MAGCSDLSAGVLYLISFTSPALTVMAQAIVKRSIAPRIRVFLSSLQNIIGIGRPSRAFPATTPGIRITYQGVSVTRNDAGGVLPACRMAQRLPP